MAKPPTSFSWNFPKTNGFSYTGGFRQFSGFPCGSHVPFHRSLTLPKRIRVPKNTDYERADFEKIDGEPSKTTITRSTNRWQNHAGRSITLQAWCSTSHVIEQRGTARQSNFIEFDSQTVSQLQFFMNYSKIRIFMHGDSNNFPAPPVGRMLHFIDLWQNLNVDGTVNRQRWFPYEGLVKPICIPNAKNTITTRQEKHELHVRAPILRTKNDNANAQQQQNT